MPRARACSAAAASSALLPIPVRRSRRARGSRHRRPRPARAPRRRALDRDRPAPRKGQTCAAAPIPLRDGIGMGFPIKRRRPAGVLPEVNQTAQEATRCTTSRDGRRRHSSPPARRSDDPSTPTRPPGGATRPAGADRRDRARVGVARRSVPAPGLPRAVRRPAAAAAEPARAAPAQVSRDDPHRAPRCHEDANVDQAYIKVNGVKVAGPANVSNLSWWHPNASLTVNNGVWVEPWDQDGRVGGTPTTGWASSTRRCRVWAGPTSSGPIPTATARTTSSRSASSASPSSVPLRPTCRQLGPHITGAGAAGPVSRASARRRPQDVSAAGFEPAAPAHSRRGRGGHASGEQPTGSLEGDGLPWDRRLEYARAAMSWRRSSWPIRSRRP